jgi:N-acetylmuramoyl-L-alanine amidase
MGETMRRLPVYLLAAALAAPVATALPTVSLSSAHPHVVPPSVAEVGAAGVDAQALAADGGAAASVAQSAEAQADAVGPLVGLTLRVLDAAAGTDGARTVVLTPARRTASFSTVGVTWDRPAGGGQPDLVVLARTHNTHGWTGWTALNVEEADVTDAGSRAPQRYGTEAVWVGPSDGVQVRIDLRTGQLPTGVRAELVNPGDSDYDAQVGATPPGTAAAQANTPTIYSRAQWGADERRVRSDPTYMPDIAAAVIHHTTDTNNYTAAQVPAIIRADYAYHLSRGWNDIGYNFLVDRFGRIWEGRRGGIAAAVQGAHAGGFNYRTFGISLIGNYETATPSAAAVAAIERLIAWRLDLAHVDPLGTTTLTAASFASARWRAGTAVRLPTIMGHRDVDYTACPGSKLYRLMSQIRSGVAKLMQAALVTPGISASSGPVGSGPRLTARVLTAQSWRLTVSDCNAGTAFTHQDGSTPARGVAVAHWDGRRGSGWANPGVYDLALSSRTATSWARPLSWSYVVNAPAPGPAPVGAAVTGSGGLVPVDAVRLLDSRSGPALATGPGGRVDLAVTGVGGIPASGVLAVALQVTALCPSTATSLTVWPAGATKPAAATVTLPARAARTSTVIVPVGAQGQVSIGNAAGVTGLLVDAVGYTTASGGEPLLAVPGTRVFHTDTTGGPLASGASRTFTLPAIGGIGADRIDAVLAQIRLRGAGAAGSVQVTGLGRASAGLPTARYEAGADTVTLAVLRPGQTQLVVANTGAAVSLSIDVVGVVPADPQAGGQLTALAATRLYDSRTAGSGGALAAGAVRQVTLTGSGSPVPADATAVLVDLGGAAATASAATVWAAGQSQPVQADLVLSKGLGGANLALVPLGAGGAVSVTSTGGLSSFTLDVVGFVR